MMFTRRFCDNFSRQEILRQVQLIPQRAKATHRLRLLTPLEMAQGTSKNF